MMSCHCAHVCQVQEVLDLGFTHRLRESDQHLPGNVVVLHQTQEMGETAVLYLLEISFA